MAGQIVEITNPGHYLKKAYGFLEIFNSEERLGRIPLDDIITVMVSVPGCTISTVLIDVLCKRNIPLMICGDDYLPCSLTLPIFGNSRQYQVMNSQIDLPLPRKKRAWQRIVRAKINNQAKVISYIGKEYVQLDRLAKKVRSGDTTNCEAQAARIYWQKLFGDYFRRRKNAQGINTALNYAYAIIRACTARGIVAAGLHPTFGIHHKNPRNAFNLVDDIMEPFRPIVDYLVWLIGEKQFKTLNPQAKQKLASILNLKIPLLLEAELVEEPPLSLSLVKISRSFVNYCQGDGDAFLLPDLPKPMEYLGF